MLLAMSVALALAAIVLAAYFFMHSRRKSGDAQVARESTPALDAWIANALEIELSEGALGLRCSTPEERQKLHQSLRGDPDPEVVSTVEDKVKTVELEYVKYAHEVEAEVTLRVRYADGSAGTASKRLPWTDVPASIRSDFEARGGSRVFRTWVFPWARVNAL